MRAILLGTLLSCSAALPASAQSTFIPPLFDGSTSLNQLGGSSSSGSSGRASVEGGNGCAQGQADPDHHGCRATEWIARETPDPNRSITYSGNSMFETPTRR